MSVTVGCIGWMHPAIADTMSMDVTWTAEFRFLFIIIILFAQKYRVQIATISAHIEQDRKALIEHQ